MKHPKTAQCLRKFGSATSSEDQSGWTGFAFLSGSGCVVQILHIAASPDLTYVYVEEHGSSPVTLQENVAGIASREQSCKLYCLQVFQAF